MKALKKITAIINNEKYKLKNKKRIFSILFFY